MTDPGVPCGDPPELSIVIVSWNCRADLLNCLESLASNPPSRSWEVSVVDNGSADGTVDAIRTDFPWVRMIANTGNRGLPAANNQGIVASAGRYLVLSNPDVLFQAGAIDALVDLLDRRPRAGFSFARLRYPDGRLQTCAGDLPTLAEALRGKRSQLVRTDGPPSGSWWHGWPHDAEVQIGHGGESCYAVRRAAIAEIGLQDERFRLDWEGLEWLSRAADAGWEAWFCPTSDVIHLGGSSVKQVPLRWVVSTHRGMYLYFAPRIRPKFLRPLLALAIFLRAAAKSITVLAGVDQYRRAHDPHGSDQ